MFIQNDTYAINNLWEVLLIFMIPFGGGIPAGVLLAQKKMIAWPVMMLLYFISDLILAIIFEPLMNYLIKKSQSSESLKKAGLIFKESLNKTISIYGKDTGFVALVIIAFGVDPMTGRAVALAHGHGFVMGWTIAILGDMIYFTTLMASTLWINKMIGSENATFFIVLILMIILPKIITRIKLFFNKS